MDFRSESARESASPDFSFAADAVRFRFTASRSCGLLAADRGARYRRRLIARCVAADKPRLEAGPNERKVKYRALLRNSADDA